MAGTGAWHLINVTDGFRLLDLFAKHQAAVVLVDAIVEQVQGALANRNKVAFISWGTSAVLPVASADYQDYVPAWEELAALALAIAAAGHR